MSDEVEKPVRKSGTLCPLFKKDVSKVCHKCDWFTRLQGKDPQSTEIVDKWGCAIAFLPMVIIEGNQMSRAVGATIENFRNELVQGVTDSVSIAAGLITQKG